MVVMPIAHDKDNGIGDGGGEGDLIDDVDDNNLAGRRGKLLSSYLCDIRAVVLVNIIAKRNLAKLFRSSSTSPMVGPWTLNATYWTIIKHACRQERGGPFGDGGCTKRWQCFMQLTSCNGQAAQEVRFPQWSYGRTQIVKLLPPHRTGQGAAAAGILRHGWAQVHTEIHAQHGLE
jgi:hypothetical protein